MGASQSQKCEDIPGWEKVCGIQLPGQSGKTRKMEEKISEYMNATRNDNIEDDFNIMISSNNRLLVEQTSKRLDADLGPDYSDSDSISSSSEASGSEYAVLKNGASTWTSSIKKHHDSIFKEIIEDEISMIVCCANSARFKKLILIISSLEKSKHFKRKINLWCDEPHKYIKLLKKEEFNRILNFRKVVKVCLVSASWDPIDKYFSIPRITYEFTHPDVYRSLHECEWRIVEPLDKEESNEEDDSSVDESIPFDMSSNAPDYVKQIFTNVNLINTIEQPGKKWLISGNSRTITHDKIAEFLQERGWNGLKLNGKAKLILITTNNESIDYNKYNKDKEEPKDVLERLFNDYPMLHSKPFFITGLNCIKEGITFQGNSFMFDGAILPDINSSSDAYQLGCRLNGNLKGLPNYQSNSKPIVITTSRMERKIKKQENIAIYLPRILYEMGLTLPTEFLKKQAARGKITHDIKGLGYRIFKDYITFKNYIDLLGRKTKFKETTNSEEGDEYYPLYTVSVLTKRGNKSIPRYVTEVIDKIDLSYGGGGGIKTGSPCYLDIKKPETLVWVAVIPNIPDIKRLSYQADSIYPDESEELLVDAVDYYTIS